MRRWIALAARLYPRSWRERYGDEFDALVDDATVDWRQLLNVTKVAIAMQLTNHVAYFKVAGALSLAGALLAVAASYRVPERYVSSAVLQMMPIVDAEKKAAPDVLQRATEDRIEYLKIELTGRDNILRILRQPNLDLYPVEREQETWEDLAEQIHDGDLRFTPISSPDGKSGAFRVSFGYPDRLKAQAVVRELVARLQQDNDTGNRETSAVWKQLWSEPIPFSEKVDVVQAASLPSSLAQPRRTIFAAVGTAIGMLVGILAMFFTRRPQFGLRIAVCGLAGCAVGAGLSLFIAEKYTARAAVVMGAPLDPVHLAGSVATTPLSEWVQRLRKEILTPENLHLVFRKPKFAMDSVSAAAVYRDPERMFGMRLKESDPLVASGPSFEITSTYPDPDIARAFVMELVAEVQSHYTIDLDKDNEGNQQLRFANEHHAGEKLVIVKQANLDDEVVTHYRPQLTIAGAAMGILLGIARWSAPSHRTSGESPLTV